MLCNPITSQGNSCTRLLPTPPRALHAVTDSSLCHPRDQIESKRLSLVVFFADPAENPTISIRENTIRTRLATMVGQSESERKRARDFISLFSPFHVVLCLVVVCCPAQGTMS